MNRRGYAPSTSTAALAATFLVAGAVLAGPEADSLRIVDPVPSSAGAGNGIVDPVPSAAGAGSGIVDPVPSSAGTGDGIVDPVPSSAGAGNGIVDPVPAQQYDEVSVEFTRLVDVRRSLAQDLENAEQKKDNVQADCVRTQLVSLDGYMRILADDLEKARIARETGEPEDLSFYMRLGTQHLSAAKSAAKDGAACSGEESTVTFEVDKSASNGGSGRGDSRNGNATGSASVEGNAATANSGASAPGVASADDVGLAGPNGDNALGAGPGGPGQAGAPAGADNSVVGQPPQVTSPAN
jgi:hypothetical protein